MQAIRIIIVYTILYAATLLAWIVVDLPTERLNWEVICAVSLSGSAVGIVVAALTDYVANRLSRGKIEREHAIAYFSGYITVAVMAAGVFWWQAIAKCLLVVIGR